LAPYTSAEAILSDLESKPNTDKAEKPAEKQASKAFNAAERNVDAAKVKEAHLANLDHHSGSAGGDQDHSLEIVGFGATASRKAKLTEKDLIDIDQAKEPMLLKGHIEENTMSQQAVLETIAALPLDKQAQIIGAGVAAFHNELEHQKFRIFVGTVAGIGDGTVSLVKGIEDTGKAICEVAQFSREIMANDPAAVDKAGKAGETIGKTLVGGVHLFQVADAYLGNIGATGDYCKPLKDIAWLGQKMNDNWQAMSPEEKTRLTTKLAVENLGAMAVGLGTNKLAKSMDVAGALEQLGTDASQLGGAAREKASKFISRMTEELAPQEVAVSPGGQKISIPRTPRENFSEALKPKAANENVMLSKADDLGESSSKIVNEQTQIRDSEEVMEAALQKYAASDSFKRMVELAVESLDPIEEAHLAKHNISVRTVRRITDIYPELSEGTAAIFDLKNKLILVAEEVAPSRIWERNKDVMFILRHEYGHAFNVTHLTDKFPISDLKSFRNCFNEDISRLGEETLKGLRLDISPEELTTTRDEVFADLYGHSTGIGAKNEYSQRMKAAFPTVLKYIQAGDFK